MENKHTYIIDRFEGDFAICERDDLKFENIKKEKLPKDIAEGDVIFFDGKKIRYIFSFSGISNKIGDEEYF